MIIAAINQRDIDGCVIEFSRGAQASKAAAQNHHSLARHHFAS